MSELTDLEICEAIAEIEGANETLYSYSDFNAPKELTAVFDGNTTFNYNPLTDDALCFRLMVKYDMAPFKCEFGGYECVYDMNLVLSGAGIVNDENPNRVICLAIIESKAAAKVGE